MRELSLNVLDIAQNSVAANAALCEIEVIKSTQNKELFIGIYDNGKGTYFVKAPDGAMIEIIQADTQIAPTPTKDWGIRHFALSVSDEGFDELVEKLREENVEVVTEVSVSSKGIKTFFFRDPEGNIFHLIYIFTLRMRHTKKPSVPSRWANICRPVCVSCWASASGSSAAIGWTSYSG